MVLDMMKNCAMEPLAERTEFPVGFGKQDAWLGRPIFAEDLGRMHQKNDQHKQAESDADEVLFHRRLPEWRCSRVVDGPAPTGDGHRATYRKIPSWSPRSR
jgi:hypothetical protein